MTAPVDTASARWLAGQCDWFATLPRLTREDAALFADAGRMLAALADALDAARQTIGLQQAALDGAATTVERYEAEVARLREAMPAAGVLESATLLVSTVAPDSRLWHELSAAAARIRALDAGVDTAEEADDDH